MFAGSEDILESPYSDTFSCEGQGYGYYADVQSGCQVTSTLLFFLSIIFLIVRFFTSASQLRTARVR